MDTNTTIESLSAQIMKYAGSTLFVNLRFMDRAIGSLSVKSAPIGSYMTDGTMLLYDPRHVIISYKDEMERPSRDYLHTVLHCVFRHMFVAPHINKALWNLASDMAVESVISGLDIRAVSVSRETEQLAELAKIRPHVHILTAERIYHHLCENPPSDDRLVALCLLFAADDHTPWFDPAAYSMAFGRSDAASASAEQSGNGDANGDGNSELSSARAALEQHWKDISAQLQQDLETFSKQRGDKAGDMMQNLAAVNREKYDYTAFLKKFAVHGEAMKINDDEFDYIYYTYGLKLYKKVPLVEPLEYKDVKRIREFVIAIDTSGSTSGALVQKFVQKTYNILKSTDSFFSKINLHIIQCDAEIQEHVKITKQEEFDEYLKTMQIRGLGGTISVRYSGWWTSWCAAANLSI